jgi:hypothetical protein
MKFYTYLIIAFVPFWLHCSLFVQDPAPFSIHIVPQNMEAISDQRCVVLVSITDMGKGTGEGSDVKITAQANNCDIIYEKALASKDKVAELVVIPSQKTDIGAIKVTVSGQRSDLRKGTSMIVNHVMGEDHLAVAAREIRDKFVPWLAANHPDLGIAPGMEWSETIVTPNLLSVSNYLFFSTEWEMGVSWILMTAPNDSAHIYLRKRFSESRPSLAFEISSVSAGDTPHAMKVPEQVIR